MKTVYLHIGDAKTGSSSIQNVLSNSADILSDQGVLYPMSGRANEKAIAHHKYARCFNSRNENYGHNLEIHSQLISEFEKSGCNQMIISSEGFCSYRCDDDIYRLKELFDGYTVKIVAYIRRPDLWVESWYCQAVKGRPFEQRKFSDYISKGQVASLEVIKNFSEIFSVKNCLFKEFEKKKFQGGNLISDFSDSLNLSLPSMEVNTESNVTPDLKTIEVIRLMNASFELSDIRRSKVNSLIVDTISEYERFSFFTLSDRQRYLSRFTGLMQYFDDNFSDDVFFEPISSSAYELPDSASEVFIKADVLEKIFKVVGELICK